VTFIVELPGINKETTLSGVPAALSEVLTGQGLLLLNITAEHAEAIRDYPELTRHDPFDRLLVAQADRDHRSDLRASGVTVVDS
jgi:PIN domain nuclease of toxin-antitoxin system